MQFPNTEELQTILERELSQHFGSPQKILRLLRQPSKYRTSFAIEELVVDLHDSNRLHLLFKNLSWQALSEKARQVKPEFLHNPLREIEVYRTILAPYRLGTATCYGVFIDKPHQSYWLFLEKVPGLELYQIGEFEKWQAVARWLAEFHARFSAHVDQLNNIPSLLRYDGAFYRRWMQRACAFAERPNDPQNRNAKAALTWLAARYEKVVEQLVALPPTFIHGEFYSSNVLVQSQIGKIRVCPVDWEMAGWGSGLIDLAALTAGKWSEEQRTNLARVYFETQSVTRDEEEFLSALNYCRLHVAMQWLGWAPNWSPPAENAHDWLGEVLHLAEKLAL
jgi:Phosphotransferase enzyme family